MPENSNEEKTELRWAINQVELGGGGHPRDKTYSTLLKMRKTKGINYRFKAIGCKQRKAENKEEFLQVFKPSIVQ